MTANDLRYNILLGVDSLYEGTAPGYNDKQMSEIINRAQRRVFRDYAKMFDSNEKVKRILSPLLSNGSLDHNDIVRTNNDPITDYQHSSTLNYGDFFTLPSDVGRIVEEHVRYSIPGGGTDPVLVLPITYDYYVKNYKNRYKMPYENLAWRMDVQTDTGNQCVEIIVPVTETIVDYMVSYLRNPIDMVVVTGGSSTDCEIQDPAFLDEIIGESIKIITASLNDEGYQNSAIEKKFDEN